IVAGGNQPLLGRKALGALPYRRHLDTIDTIAPGVPLGEYRLVLAIGKLQAIELAASPLAHVLQPDLDVGENVGPERAHQIRAPRRIVFVLIAKLGSRLRERHATTLPPRRQDRQGN